MRWATFVFFFSTTEKLIKAALTEMQGEVEGNGFVIQPHRSHFVCCWRNTDGTSGRLHTREMPAAS